MATRGILFRCMALGLSLCACGPKVKDLAVSKEFKNTPLDGSTFIVGGLTSSFAGPAADSMLESGALWMRDGLVENVAGINVPPLEYALQTLGEDSLKRLLDLFNQTLLPSKNQLDPFKQPDPAGKIYLVLARLESDRQWTDKEEKKDSSGTVLSRSYKSNRQLMATFSVWNVMTTNRVWNGQVSGKTTSAHTVNAEQETDYSDLGIVGAVLDVFDSSGEGPEPEPNYPATPGLHEVTPVLFKNFAKAMSSR